MKIYNLKLPNGNEPFEDWISKLDETTQARIYVYLHRLLEGGGKHNVKSIGDNLFELKINFGPGYRVYFVFSEKDSITVLCGGDKKSQDRDIEKARDYRRKYVPK